MLRGRLRQEFLFGLGFQRVLWQKPNAMPDEPDDDYTLLRD